MRRMVKERLLKFDGKPLFPERIAYTVPYRLSEAEARLYTAVTDYVREEFNRAEALANAKRAGTVGFALTLLQRRLASSPEAIYQSLRRRRERLESRLRELEVLQRGGQHAAAIAFTAPELDADDIADLDDAPEQEAEDAEAHILDQATAARSIVELKAEIETLKALESLALGVRRSGADTKWRELAGLLGEIFTAVGRPEPATSSGDGEIRRPSPSPRQKLVLLHRAPGHAALPAGAHHNVARPRNVGRRHPRQRGPRAAPGRAGSLPARPAGAGAAGDRPPRAKASTCSAPT